MPEEEIILEEDDGFEEQLCSDIANLSTAYNSLSEIDSALLPKSRQAKLQRMKRQIFDALAYYTDCLPQLIEDEEED